jgi:putative ABC transport system ATP-binding protein
LGPAVGSAGPGRYQSLGVRWRTGGLAWTQRLRQNHHAALYQPDRAATGSLARALANNPRVILADEPTASLDTVRGKKVMELLKKIAKENQSAVIVITHDVRMIEGFDYVYHLKDGHLNHQVN